MSLRNVALNFPVSRRLAAVQEFAFIMHLARTGPELSLMRPCQHSTLIFNNIPDTLASKDAHGP